MRNIYDDFNIDSKIEKNYPKALQFACGAQCKDSCVIGPEGYIYKCWEDVGLKQHAIGTLEKINEDCEENQRYLADFWPEECAKCTYLPLCHDGCPKRRFENNNKPYCSQITKVLDKYLKKYYFFWNKENEVS